MYYGKTRFRLSLVDDLVLRNRISAKIIPDFLQILFDLLFSVWLGATDKDVETAFRWTDGSIVSWVKWDRFQPKGRVNNDNDCIAVNRETKKWADYDCDANITFYCETAEGKLLQSQLFHNRVFPGGNFIFC